MEKPFTNLVDFQGAAESPMSLATAPLTISPCGVVYGFNGQDARKRPAQHPETKEYYSIHELAERWRVSRGTVYNRLRAAEAKVLDFSVHGHRSKKAVHVSVVSQIEARNTKRLC